MRRLLITGGAGFIGSNFVHLHREGWPEDRLVVIDALTYAGRRENLPPDGFTFVHGDIAQVADVEAAWDVLGTVDAVVHFAAESHVDRSIADPAPFVRTNLLGTQVLLDVARRRGVGLFLHVSTDEVYGTLSPTDPAFTEATPLAPNSPYAASKAGADCLVRAAFHTHGLPTVITRCSNNYGPRQHPEKFIPLLFLRALRRENLPIYGDGQQVRDWVHVDDHNTALTRVLAQARPGAVYNIGGDSERTNLEIARLVCEITGCPTDRITHVADRPGHDRRYAMDIRKIGAELGWRPQRRLEEALVEVERWYREAKR